MVGTSMTNTIATATPVEIDTILAEIWGRIYAVQAKVAAVGSEIRRAEKMARYGGLQRIPALEARIVELQAELPPIEAEAEPYEAEYASRPWTRAFLVSNSNGHVHKDMNCSSCFITTQYAWMIDYSGKDEAEIVADAGCMACTVCFPSAPVEGLASPTKMFASPEAKAKAEKKAAAEAAKCKGSLSRDYDRSTARMNYYSGNYGKCEHCGENVTLTSSNALRSHKGKVVTG